MAGRSNYSPLINVMSDAAFKAARSLLRDFSEVEKLQISFKGPNNFVSSADRRAEETIYNVLYDAYPDYNIIMEEAGKVIHEDEDAPYWVIDPLNGTKNFLHSIPHFSISIALKEHDTIIAGVVYDPIRDEMFWAQKDFGAFLNENRIIISNNKSISNSIVAVNSVGISASQQNNNQSMQFMKDIASIVSDTRSLGSPALDLCYVAANRFGGVINNNAIEWDVAAGIIIIEEAGGVISDFSHDNMIIEKKQILAGNRQIHTKLLEIFNK